MRTNEKLPANPDSTGKQETTSQSADANEVRPTGDTDTLYTDEYDQYCPWEL
jgi:hypothetical protein